MRLEVTKNAKGARQAMEITLTKGQRDDCIAVRRLDGSEAVTRFPKKGPVPHDAVHWFVERGLGLEMGFWGLVAAGHHPEDLVELAKAGGHASAKRAAVPDAGIVQLLQAERLVECFEADLWSGHGDDEALLETASAGCGASHVPMPDCPPETVSRIRDALAEFACAWMDADVGHVARLVWPDNTFAGAKA